MFARTEDPVDSCPDENNSHDSGNIVHVWRVRLAPGNESWTISDTWLLDLLDPVAGMTYGKE